MVAREVVEMEAAVMVVAVVREAEAAAVGEAESVAMEAAARAVDALVAVARVVGSSVAE